eukprot:5889636-Amphidinium_carterae.1
MPFSKSCEKVSFGFQRQSNICGVWFSNEQKVQRILAKVWCVLTVELQRACDLMQRVGMVPWWHRTEMDRVGIHLHHWGVPEPH